MAPKGATRQTGRPFIRAELAAAYALKGEIERAAAELAEARRLSPADRYSSIARTEAFGSFRAAEGPRVVRKNLLRRPQAGRNAGGMKRRPWGALRRIDVLRRHA
jgi:hypothetical protein